MSIIPYVGPPRFGDEPRETVRVYTGEEVDAHRRAVWVELNELANALHEAHQQLAADTVARVRNAIRLETPEHVYCEKSERILERPKACMRYDADEVGRWTYNVVQRVETVPDKFVQHQHTATQIEAAFSAIYRTIEEITPCQTK